MPVKLNRCAQDVSCDGARDIVERIQNILWHDFDENTWNPDKEWDAGTIELVSAVLEEYGLKPTET